MPRMVEKIFEGRILSLNREEHELPDGRRAVFEMVRHPGGATILPVLGDGRVLLIRQFRPAAGGMVWEIPAGRLEPGESPRECVAREIQEEIGYRADKIEPLGEMLTAVGFCDEVVYLFLGSNLEPVERALEPDEYIEVVPTEFNEALAMVARGDIPDGKTQLALLLAARRGGE
ncbi:ADP-ribose pyrophosphatase [Geoalkalibacter ferrihydriticus]|uniref:GDP-mannose pyrophosphatase n=2 Tax=Geoalkalibacter ferrihydriticus TaxID=392333 RepID=A0A0C2HGT7_9BACT|nr:NUDIX hydrolase [Geoalkalibacter ferrihydriticus]KIH76161.1 ADP-ribose pyrophosphatase [Geoalkalibacter ferrihydriticus DSM 17813]SDM41820.1 ADP-ribose pyrophosphatase [Geoalkalibacter ferrihydriticus]